MKNFIIYALRLHRTILLSVVGILLLGAADSETSLLDVLNENDRAVFDSLPLSKQQGVLDQLRTIGNFDSNTHLDSNGRIFFVENPVNLPERELVTPQTIFDTPPSSGYTPEGVPIYHSNPGSLAVIYINFLGGPVEETAWNEQYAMHINALPFNLDGIDDFSTTEQIAMAGIWKRVAEDYAPWEIDLTTERPAVFTNRTLEIMITKNVQADGRLMPSGLAGGVAYLDIFDFYDRSYYSPAFVYYNQLMGREDFVAEATAHELGHNVGLSHDGLKGINPYYPGLGQGEASWGPLMGTPLGQRITKFSNGDYPGASNQEDDIAIITSRVSLRADAVGNTPETAKPLQKANKSFKYSGLLEHYEDVDVFSIQHSGGKFSVSVDPFRAASFTGGNNVDLGLQLLGPQGDLGTSTPDASSSASMSSYYLLPGTYYIRVFATGNQFTTKYGSMGQYDLTGTYESDEQILCEASMDTYPTGWELSPGVWEYGVPTSSSDPKTYPVLGTVISGSGLYPEPIPLTPLSANSKEFSTVGLSKIRLEFDRFLGVEPDDYATIHICRTNASGLLCSMVWLNGVRIKDTSWKRIALPLTKSMLNQPRVHIRFGIGPTYARGGRPSSSFGWNIRNVKVLGN